MLERAKSIVVMFPKFHSHFLTRVAEVDEVQDEDEDEEENKSKKKKKKNVEE